MNFWIFVIAVPVISVVVMLVIAYIAQGSSIEKTSRIPAGYGAWRRDMERRMK